MMMRGAVVGAISAMFLSGCGFSPYSLPLPGGADVGDDPYKVKVHFRDVLDLVPQSAVRVNDVAVGKVRKIELNGWTAVVTVEVNRKVKLPDNALATIRQTSLLGEKFVSLDAPAEGSIGELRGGDVIPLDRSGRNPEIEEVLGAMSLLFNGGGLEKTKTIVQEFNKTLDGREPEIKSLLSQTNSLVGQLDENKQALLTSLEKVNRLAVETNKQKGAITKALDELPAALTVINEQRDDLVRLLQALDRLADVGVRVIKESKADVIKDLQLLVPAIRELANAGDDLPETLSTLATFPFSDGYVGGSATAAKDYHQGDYSNLSVRLDISADQLSQFLDLDGSAPSLTGSSSAPVEGLVEGLVELVTGLIPAASADLPDLPSLPDGIELPGLDQLPGASSNQEPGTTSDQGQTGTPELSKFCSLLGTCRVSPGSYADAIDTDLGKILVASVVTK